MCNQMAKSEIKKIISRAFCQNSDNFDKTQMKLFPNFTRKPFHYLLMLWVTNYAHNRNCFYWFIVLKTENIKKNTVFV